MLYEVHFERECMRRAAHTSTCSMRGGLMFPVRTLEGELVREKEGGGAGIF